MRQPFPRFLIVLLLLAAFWLAVREMRADSIWYDEYWSLYYAGAAPQYGPVSLAETWGRVGDVSHELNPPGYYLLLNVWGHLAGWRPFTARMLSAFVGLLAVAWGYRLGNDLDSGQRAGLSTAVALATSAFYIYYMHEIRAYVFMPLLVFTTMWAYIQFMRRGAWWLAVALLISLTSMIYVHYMHIAFIAAAAVYHLLFVRKTRRWLVVVLTVAGAALLFLPWALEALSAFRSVSTDLSRSFYADDALTLTGKTLMAFGNGSLVLLVIFGWYAVQKRRFWLIGFLGIVTLSVTLLVNDLVRFISDPRYLLALLPLLMLMVGFGAARMAQLRLRPAVLLAVWVVSGFFLSLEADTLRAVGATDDKQLTWSWDSLAEILRPYQRPGETVIYFLPEPVPHWMYSPVAAYYFYDLPAVVEPMPRFVVPPLGVPEDRAMSVHLVESLEDKPPSAYRQEARAILEGLNVVWVAFNPTYLPSPFTRPAFETVLTEQGFSLCQQPVADPQLALLLYARLPDPDTDALIHYDDDVNLHLLTPIAETVGDHLSLILGWRLGAETPRGVYSTALHVENNRGELVAQADAGLPYESNTCQPIRLDLNDLPPGMYTLKSVVYNWQTGERLIAGGDDRPVIGTFAIDNMNHAETG